MFSQFVHQSVRCVFRCDVCSSFLLFFFVARHSDEIDECRNMFR